MLMVNVVTKRRNNLQRPKTTYNNLQRNKTTYNDLYNEVVKTDYGQLGPLANSAQPTRPTL